MPRATFINEPKNSHLDPLTAAPGKSRFLKTVVPFLKSLEITPNLAAGAAFSQVRPWKDSAALST